MRAKTRYQAVLLQLRYEFGLYNTNSLSSSKFMMVSLQLQCNFFLSKVGTVGQSYTILNSLRVLNKAELSLADYSIQFLSLKTTRMQRDLRESEAQREDQEARISTLEQRYLAAQHDATAAHEKANRIGADLIGRDSELKQVSLHSNSHV